MRVVTLEEHFNVPSLLEKMNLNKNHLGGLAPEIRERLSEIGEQRLNSMNESEITIQVLSSTAPGAEALSGQAGVDFARQTNDVLSTAVKKYPGRFAGFAHLPMQDPTASASELERAVTHLGFRGALISGTTQGLFLDDPKFSPLLAKAEQLDVPLYLHPALPPETVRRAYYDNLPANYGLMLSMAGFGWHIEVGLHVLRLVLSGTFQRHPRLKIIIGHMGETLPFMLERANDVFSAQKVPVSVKETILKHVWVTTSGFFTIPPFLNALQVFGADRILFSVDYPFARNDRGSAFLKTLPVSPEDLKKIAHQNADNLLHLT
jgi:uncharacterized protein